MKTFAFAVTRGQPDRKVFAKDTMFQEACFTLWLLPCNTANSFDLVGSACQNFALSLASSPELSQARTKAKN